MAATFTTSAFDTVNYEFKQVDKKPTLRNMKWACRKKHPDKDKGYVKKIGVSIYNPAQFYKTLDIIDPDIIQFPLNILDQRFLNINFSLFKKRIEFHARSIFLQGLLLNDIKKLPKFFFPIKKKLVEINPENDLNLKLNCC